MIAAATLVPHPPLLLRELVGAQDPVPELRAAVHAAVRDLVASGHELVDEVVVVGDADVARTWDPAAGFDVRRFGTAAPRAEGLLAGQLPLSLGVGVRLLEEAGWTGPVLPVSVPWDAADDDLDALAADLVARPGRTAVLLLGDGSARRGERAPGYLDERAFGFDEALAKALADGDAVALTGLDTGLAEELLVLGAAVFRLLGALAGRRGGPVGAALEHREAPFGVSYFVTSWRFEDRDGPG